MKVRMIEGFYGNPGNESDYYLAPVAYPMQETLEHPLDQGEDDVTITNEFELKEWAEEKFMSYDIWDMEIPPEAIVTDGQSIHEMFEAVDAEITEVNYAGFPTSPLTTALDLLWQVLEPIDERRCRCNTRAGEDG